jgi:hypothetical protein
MATAMTVGAGATGIRAVLAARSPAWLTARRLKGVTAAILAAGVIASGAHLAPNGSTAHAGGPPPPAASSR